MKTPEDMKTYHKKIPKGTEIILKKETWVNEGSRKDYLSFLDEILKLDSDVFEFGLNGPRFLAT